MRPEAVALVSTRLKRWSGDENEDTASRDNNPRRGMLWGVMLSRQEQGNGHGITCAHHPSEGHTAATAVYIVLADVSGQ